MNKTSIIFDNYVMVKSTEDDKGKRGKRQKRKRNWLEFSNFCYGKMLENTSKTKRLNKVIDNKT